jgi:hypothetical protein
VHVVDESGQPTNVEAGRGYGIHADDAVALGRSMNVRGGEIGNACRDHNGNFIRSRNLLGRSAVRGVSQQQVIEHLTHEAATRDY